MLREKDRVAFSSLTVFPVQIDSTTVNDEPVNSNEKMKK